MNKKFENELKKIMSRKGHERIDVPSSRRDFIRHGLIAGGGALLPLSPLQRAFAQSADFLPKIPFLVFDLAGGAGLPANFLVGKNEGPEDLCQTYKLHGWNPRSSGSLDKTFGLPMAAQASDMLTGLKRTLPQSILKQGENKLLQMASMCHFSLSDVTSNKASALALISNMGLVGSTLRSGVGQIASLSGGNSQAFQAIPQRRPKLIQSYEDITNLTSLGSAFLKLDEEAKKSIRDQLVRAAGDYPDLIEAYKEFSQFGDLHVKGDPKKSEKIMEAYQLNQGSSDQELVEAGIVYNVLMGYTGPGVITIGDCDYHDRDATFVADKDRQIGESIGKAIHAAHLLGKPLFFQIITDGGVYAPDSDNYERIWEGDQNLHSLTVIGYYDPKGGTQMRRLQVGEYTARAEVRLASATEESREEFFISKKPENMVLAVVANYLKLHGEEGRFQEITGSRAATKTIDDFLVFG